ncbi:MAG: nickel-dependent lactate racemase [Deltaproteobacteria bacterium]|nr:MAG: nickel-dependent lactate racemase [Deltaproteobacteria bacterium]
MPERHAKLLCGEGTVDLGVPETVTVLDMKTVEPLLDPEGAVYKALADPIESPPLKEVARGRKNACVVISDITRPVPNQTILPLLLKVLEESGIGREEITILIATGMHRPNLGEELESVVGRQVMSNFKIVNHYCRKSKEYRKIDEIEGAPIEVNKHYLDADLKILTGLIEPHFYAGYSGGRKAILPGISSFETMKFMHSYKMIDHPKVTNCLLEGNPFHEYGIRVTELAGVDFILNVVINKERKIAGVFAGHYNQAHLAGCDMVYENSTVTLDNRVDLVITSGGGYPLDATFYQISKALICARDILKKGGTIVVACECREGLGGPEFCGILRSVCSPQEFFEGYCDPKNFVIDQWCAQNIYQVLDHAGKVYVYSPSLSQEDLGKMGAIKINNVQETVNELIRGRENVVLVPDGPYVVGIIKGGIGCGV